MVAIFGMNPDSTIHTVNKSVSQTVCPSVYQPLTQLDSQLHFCNWSNRQSISVSAIHTVIYSLLIKQSVHQSINLLYMQLASQCAVRKKMVAVHFITIPFEPNMANYTYFVERGGGGGFVPVIATLPILGLKFIKLVCEFLWAILWFSCAKNCG